MTDTFDRLKARVEAAGLDMGISRKTFNDNDAWVDGTININEPNLPDEGDGGYFRDMAQFHGRDAIINAHRFLDGRDARAKARRCVNNIILLLHSVAEPTQIGGLLPPPYGKQVAQGAIEIIRNEFDIEEDV